MQSRQTGFNTIVETIYKMPLDERMELQNLLEHNIAEARRSEIAVNYRKALREQKDGKIKFRKSKKNYS